MWHFKEDDEDEADIERLDLLEEETEPLENIIDESSTPMRRVSTETVNPFLESGPIENLEQGLAQAQTPSSEDNPDKPGEIDGEPLLYNAPQYGGGYDSASYENKAFSDVEQDISGGALMTRDTSFHQGEQRTVDAGAWQQEQTQGTQSQQQYQAKQPERFKQQEVLPFDVGESIKKL